MIGKTDRQMKGWAKSITLFQGFNVTWACQKKEASSGREKRVAAREQNGLDKHS